MHLFSLSTGWRWFNILLKESQYFMDNVGIQLMLLTEGVCAQITQQLLLLKKVLGCKVKQMYLQAVTIPTTRTLVLLQTSVESLRVVHIGEIVVEVWGKELILVDDVTSGEASGLWTVNETRRLGEDESRRLAAM